MNKGLRVSVIVIVVILVVIIAFILTVRSIMMSAKVKGIVVERIEKRVGADITIGGVSVNFPFGANISLKDLNFKKVDRNGKSIEFSSDAVTVHPSIISIIKRKPELSSFAVENGTVLYSSPKSSVRLVGFDVNGSLGLSENEKAIAAFTLKADSLFTNKSPIAVVAVKVDGKFEEGKNILTLSSIGFSVAGGSAKGIGTVSTSKKSNLAVSTTLSITGVSSKELSKSFPSLPAIFDGLFDLEAKSTFIVDENGEVLVPSIDSRGSIHSEGGRMDVSSILSELEPLAPEIYSFLKKARYDDFSLNYRVSNGWVKTDDWKIKSSKGDWYIKGAFSLKGKLNYSARLIVTPDVQKGMDVGKYRNVLNLLKDEKGNLILKFEIGGIAQRPRVSLDLDNVKVKAAGMLFDNIMKNFKK